MKINNIEYNWKAMDSDGAISYHVDKPVVSNHGGEDQVWRSMDEFDNGEVDVDYRVGLKDWRDSLEFIGSGWFEAGVSEAKMLNIIEKLVCIVSSQSGCSKCSNAADHYKRQIEVGELMGEIEKLRSK